jgi:4-hydroxy-tetrahydrodipicolinate synthase
MGSFFAPRDWGRLLTAMLTPFHANGEVNYEEVKRIARYLVDEQGNDGLVVNGTTGESPTLSDTEKISILETVLAEVGDRAAVVFGAGTYNTAESIHLTETGTKAGAHGIMLVNPYYNRPGQDGMVAHFSAVAAKTELPVMIYNIQPRSAINLETPTLMRLADIPNVVAVKEASGNLGQIQDVCAQAPCGFRVYSGDDGLTLPILSVGGHGVVSVAGHIVGNQIKAMLNAFEDDPTESRKIHLSLLPVYRALFAFPSPVPVKYAMSLRGFNCANVRLPLVELSPEQQSALRPFFEA